MTQGVLFAFKFTLQFAVVVVVVGSEVAEVAEEGKRRKREALEADMAMTEAVSEGGGHDGDGSGKRWRRTRR